MKLETREDNSVTLESELSERETKLRHSASALESREKDLGDREAAASILEESLSVKSSELLEAQVKAEETSVALETMSQRLEQLQAVAEVNWAGEGGNQRQARDVVGGRGGGGGEPPMEMNLQEYIIM